MKENLKYSSYVLIVHWLNSFVDNYFEISKHIDIFTSLYKELNLFYG